MERSSNHSSANITPVTHNFGEVWERWENIDFITDCVRFSVLLPGLCFVAYGLYSLVKTGHFSQVFIINLFISDLIQTSVGLMEISTYFLIKYDLIPFISYYTIYMFVIYLVAVVVNACFMMCISAERYIIIAHPVWYRNIHTIRKSVFVSVTLWIIVPIIGIIVPHYTISVVIILEILLLFLPYPLMTFFFVGTWRALSSNTSVPHHEQRRIMATLALILCIYTVLFLPYGVRQIYFYLYLLDDTYYQYLDDVIAQNYFFKAAIVLMSLNPLFDCLLYLFIRRDAKDILRALFCFCKRNEDNRESVDHSVEAQETAMS